jgi:hypothetical protein
MTLVQQLHHKIVGTKIKADLSDDLTKAKLHGVSRSLLSISSVICVERAWRIYALFSGICFFVVGSVFFMLLGLF